MPDGKLINAYIHNPNYKSHYSGFEIVTCREISDYDGGTIIEQVKTVQEYLNSDELAIDEPFYRVYAIHRPTWAEKYINYGYVEKRRCLGDFFDIKDAQQFLQELTGLIVDIYSI